MTEPMTESMTEPMTESMTESMTEPIRLLEYVTPSSMGGAEHGLLIEGPELTRRGHDVLYAAPAGRRLTQLLQKRDLPVWAPHTYGKVDPLTLVRLVWLIRTRRIQLVHSHLSTASLLGSLAARICGIPCVATVHGLNTATCFRFTTLVVAISWGVRDHLVSQGFPVDRIRVVYNGIDMSRFQSMPGREEARRALKQPTDAPIVLYVGRLSREKGVLLLPAILQAIRREVPRARMLIVGEGALESEMLADFQKLGLVDSVELMGYQSDPRPHLAACDLLVLPSHREAQGRVLLEAMAARRPTVGTLVGGIPEVICEGVTGELAPPGNVDAIAKSCTSLLQNPSKAEQYGLAGRLRTEAMFSVQSSISALERVFAEAMGRDEAPAPSERTAPWSVKVP